MPLLCDFEIIRPPYETDQAATLDWLVGVHMQGETRKPHPDPFISKQTLQQAFEKVGCKPDRIAKRGHILSDYLHRNWNQMQVYRVDQFPNGCDLSVRSFHFEQYVDSVFEQYYPETYSAPDDLIHVSCTGYVSPSGAQKVASKRNWGSQTVITHAYHMGCYASIPAIRMARGFLASEPEKTRVDIVHTEICSLHTNPASHKADQLVSQSLFADGFIKYSIKKTSAEPHYQLLAVHEEIIPDCIESMTWKVAHWGFEMVLFKEVPVFITRALPDFLKRLARKAGKEVDFLLNEAVFAVHPGGPKILVYIQERLQLKETQMAHSFTILREYGNMSSATLPHIWQAVLADSTIPTGAPIVSLAFGPGLSITGSIMEKVCGS